MPDLSHRPSRYAVASASAAALLVLSVSTFDLRLTSQGKLSAAEREASDLEREVARLRRRLATRPDDGRDEWSTARVGLPPAEAQADGDDGSGDEPDDRAAPASAGPNCSSYPFQEAAQAALDRSPTTFRMLDGDGDGLACEQLKTSTVPTSPAPPGSGLAAPPTTLPPRSQPPPFPDAPSKAEILASGMHFGVAATTEEERHDVEFLVDRDATINPWYKGWDRGFEADRVTESWRDGEIPMITWESRPLAPEPDGTDYSLARILDGSFDGYIQRYAEAVRDLGLPVIIRFDHEMNGNWYRWCEFDTPYGNKRGDYVKVWRRVHDLFAAVGANDHVIWVWAPSRVDNLTRFPAIDRYYPGHEYVDWVGMSGYLRPGDSPATFTATYRKTLNELRRVAPGKPILLAEIGATESGGEKAKWTRSLFPGLLNNPDVAGFVWFNYAVTENRVTNDWRITSSPAVQSAVKLGMATSGYGRPRGAPPTLVPRHRVRQPG